MAVPPRPLQSNIVLVPRYMKTLAIATSILVLAGCAARHVAAPLPFFPRLAPPAPGLAEIWLTAAFDGRLVVEDGCVKVHPSNAQRSVTVLWHQDIELRRDTKGLFLLTPRNGHVTRFDVPANFGGGLVSAARIQQTYPEVARRCGPPYAYGYPVSSY